MTATEVSPLEEALTYEEGIAQRARDIRGDATELTPALLNLLLPLLKEPIPTAFIQTIPSVTGKPYVSTGIRSVQVQINRMDNVLTPLWWWEQVRYENDGKLCHVTVFVGHTLTNTALCARSSYGGVDRASTVGNLFKGSYTNAAKLALARFGPGHEVYVGMEDLDPDTSKAAAKQQAKRDQSEKKPRKLTGEEIAKVKTAVLACGKSEQEWKIKLVELGAGNERDLTSEHAHQLRQWIDAEAKA